MCDVENEPPIPPNRTDPTEPKSDKGSLAQYVEESSANTMLIDAISKLFEVHEKPEDPIEWLQAYFRQLAPARAEELLEIQNTLRKDLVQKESELAHFRMQESRLKERREELQYESKKLKIVVPKPNHDENYRRYKEVEGDIRWRIKPDPTVVVTKSDTLLQVIEHDKKSRMTRF